MIMKKKKKYEMFCECCEDGVDKCLNCFQQIEDGDELWCSSEGHFCSAECCARYRAEETYAISKGVMKDKIEQRGN